MGSLQLAAWYSHYLIGKFVLIELFLFVLFRPRRKLNKKKPISFTRHLELLRINDMQGGECVLASRNCVEIVWTLIDRRNWKPNHISTTASYHHMKSSYVIWPRWETCFLGKWAAELALSFLLTFRGLQHVFCLYVSSHVLQGQIASRNILKSDNNQLLSVTHHSWVELVTQFYSFVRGPICVG
jgi:hypothetical protein